MLKYAAEFIGTFIFLTVILNAVAKNSPMASVAPLAIGIALIAAIQFGGGISGGHFNPAVTAMFAMKGDLPSEDIAPYIGAQLLGAVAAKYFFDASNEAKQSA
jgi:glycerol uptake facilitator-like aquaporin